VVRFYCIVCWNFKRLHAVDSTLSFCILTVWTQLLQNTVNDINMIYCFIVIEVIAVCYFNDLKRQTTIFWCCQLKNALLELLRALGRQDLFVLQAPLYSEKKWDWSLFYSVCNKIFVLTSLHNQSYWLRMYLNCMGKKGRHILPYPFWHPQLLFYNSTTEKMSVINEL